MFAITILSRVIHIFTAALVIGSVFALRYLLSAPVKQLPEEYREPFRLKLARRFKIFVHSAITLLILSGAYNSYVIFPKYNAHPHLLHPLWGMHLLAALVVFGIALYATAGIKAPGIQRKLLSINLSLLFVVVVIGSTLKWARENAGAISPNPTTMPITKVQGQ